MDISRKRWDHRLGVWVLDVASVSEPQKYWDPKEGKWKTEAQTVASGATKEQTIEVSSCELPPRQLGPGTPGSDPTKPKDTYVSAQSSYHSHVPSYQTSHHYRTIYPWEGVDRAKWPSTWNMLFFLYFQHDWHTRGRYIDARDWDARLRGEYKPEPKYPRNYYDYDGA